MPLLRFCEVVGHTNALRRLQSLIREGGEGGGEGQALLLMGPEGVGKSAIAQIFIRTLFCTDRQHTPLGLEPCLQCVSCLKLTRRAHPDFLYLAPYGKCGACGERSMGPGSLCIWCGKPEWVQESPEIKIDAIRKMQASLIFAPLEAHKKVVLIDPADAMTIEASNSLLKILEEPPSDAILILIAHRAELLPATLRSRCQKLSFPGFSLGHIAEIVVRQRGLDPDIARQIVLIAAGKLNVALSLTPEEACSLEADLHRWVDRAVLQNDTALFGVAKNSAADADILVQGLYYLTTWFRDILVTQAMRTHGVPHEFIHAARQDEIASWAERINADQIGFLLARIQDIERGQARHINNALALETLLIALGRTGS